MIADSPHSSHGPRRARQVALAAAVVALVAWTGWWGVSFSQHQGMGAHPWWRAHLPKPEMKDPGHVWLPLLVGGGLTWAPTWDFLGLDYLVADDMARLHHAGVDVYAPGVFEDAPVAPPVPWPGSPLFFGIYCWCPWVERRVGIIIWTTALAGVASAAAWMAWRSRQALPVTQLPFPVVLAAVLCSYPVVFEMERGQSHLLGELGIMGMILGMRRRTWRGDAAAGLCLALAGLLKYYPLILLAAVSFLRRPRVTVFAALSLIGIVLGTFRSSARAFHNLALLAAYAGSPLMFFSHSATGAWGLPATALILFPLAAWVSFRLYRSPVRDKLAYPYLLWVCGLGTFIPSSTMDYNLHYLPLAALVVWDRRDGWWIHAGMGLMLIWWQPFAFFSLPVLPQGIKPFFYIKVLSLVPIAACIVKRAAEGRGEGDAAPSKGGGLDALANVTARPTGGLLTGYTWSGFCGVDERSPSLGQNQSRPRDLNP